MAEISIVVPPLHRDKYSGGIICVLEYARGLVRKGHKVRLLPLLPSVSPRWIEGNIGELRVSSMGSRAGSILRSLLAVARSVPKGKQDFISEVRKLTTAAALFRAAAFPLEIQSALGIIYTRELLESQKSDITLATDYKTVLPVVLYGSGDKFYFAQHYEPYFAIDNPNPRLAEREAWMSYQHGAQIIANSSWLKDRLCEEFGFSDIAVCPNAINHEIFKGSVKDDDFGRTVRVISYGGRDAQWKGFKEMAQAMAIARRQLPKREIRWLVYGSSILAPKNDYAEYEPLGFLNLPKLAQAYREADLRLAPHGTRAFRYFRLKPWPAVFRSSRRDLERRNTRGMAIRRRSSRREIRRVSPRGWSN